ncbi:MAG: ABC transporter ATP-binding protein [Phycisphaerales bacterium]|nr:ABC transporter ATP-binding protein [Phycisphaerales bacterium]
MTARGRIVFDGQDILTLASATLRKIRGNHISMIFQEPMSCLNPAMTLGRQIVEPLELHQKIRGGAARRAGIELLARVGISDPAARFDAYPHEISGGMRQRVMIAMAIACRPKALIADEPTTALDVTIQAQILALLAELQRDAGMAILFITHDMAVVSQVAHHVTVMRHGAAVESGETAHVLFSPRHEYTRTLLNCVPRFTDDVEASPTELERHRADSTARPTH